MVSKTTFDERVKISFYSWEISSRLFGDTGCNIYDFDESNYKYFLDNVRSLEDLMLGLYQLSPFADDALDVASLMTEDDFLNFKIALARERHSAKEDEDSVFPSQYDALLVPEKFLSAALITQEFQAPLGVALIKFMEHGKEINTAK